MLWLASRLPHNRVPLSINTNIYIIHYFVSRQDHVLLIVVVKYLMADSIISARYWSKLWWCSIAWNVYGVIELCWLDWFHPYGNDQHCINFCGVMELCQHYWFDLYGICSIVWKVYGVVKLCWHYWFNRYGDVQHCLKTLWLHAVVWIPAFFGYSMQSLVLIKSPRYTRGDFMFL